MDMFGDVSDTLVALLEDHGVADPTFQRMVGVYRDVADALGARRDYERTVTALLGGHVTTISAGPPMIVVAGDRRGARRTGLGRQGADNQGVARRSSQW